MKRRKLIKRVIWGAVLLLALAALFYFVILPLFAGDSNVEDGGVRVYAFNESESLPLYTLENEDLKLELDPKTTHFTITQKSNGHVWYSNPPEADQDPIALPADIASLKSTLSLVYSTANGVNTNFYNYTYSIEKGIYEIEQVEDALIVRYSLGKVSKTYVVPQAITEARMNEYLANMTSRESKDVKEYFRLVNLNKLRAADNRDELVALYPDLENENVYVLRDNVADYLKVKIEGYLENAGYTYEDYVADMERCSVGGGNSDKPVFDVTFVYRLEGKELLVEIPFEEIDYNPSYPITKLSVLPNFGAGGTADTGYMLVPDGGGALIHFNNGKIPQNPYYANNYGWDYALGRKFVVNETRSAFPAFGIASGDSSFLCVMEDYASVGGINADISGRYHSYNTAYATYVLLHADAFDVSEKSNESVYLFEAALPSGSITQRYLFTDSSSYVDLAVRYREYLLNKYPQLALKTDASTPVALEIVGAVDKVKQILGVPTSAPLVLTKYAEATDILKMTLDAGFSNLHVKLSGWTNGGINQKILRSTSLISNLGTEKDLREFLDFAAQAGVPTYLDGVTQFAYDSGIADGFLTFRDAAKYTTREQVKLKEYNPIWYGQRLMDDAYYLVKPSLMLECMQVLGNAAEKYGAAGVSLRDTGYLLSANYDPRDLVTRHANIALQQEALEAYKDQGLGVMVKYGNDYALPYADIITDMDLNGVGYSMTDENVPFYQIALHGYVNYTGEAINLAGDYETELLNSAEAGAGLSFVFMKESAMALQDTFYSEYYGADVALWFEKATALYTEYNAQLGHLYGQTIIRHERISDYVTITTYADGTRVYVNYGTTEASVDGVTLAPRSYLAKGASK